ncbi:MAG: hypothetical protein ACK59R_14970 [Pseudomonadota bacterium]
MQPQTGIWCGQKVAPSPGCLAMQPTTPAIFVQGARTCGARSHLRSDHATCNQPRPANNGSTATSDNSARAATAARALPRSLAGRHRHQPLQHQRDVGHLEEGDGAVLPEVIHAMHRHAADYHRYRRRPEARRGTRAAPVAPATRIAASSRGAPMMRARPVRAAG